MDARPARRDLQDHLSAVSLKIASKTDYPLFGINVSVLELQPDDPDAARVTVPFEPAPSAARGRNQIKANHRDAESTEKATGHR